MRGVIGRPPLTMSLFLSTVAQRHAAEFIIMVMDQAGWHIASALEVPHNLHSVLLPPYNPEINPAEHIWKALRDDCCANTVSPAWTPQTKRSARVCWHSNPIPLACKVWSDSNGYFLYH